jgi:hypothetical protein
MKYEVEYESGPGWSFDKAFDTPEEALEYARQETERFYLKHRVVLIIEPGDE